MRWEEFSRIDLEALVPLQIMERGINYYQEGRLLKACRIGPVLCGELLGSGANYKTRLWWDDSGLKWECSCPYPEFCKHLTALALAWIDRGSGFIDLTPCLDQICRDPQMLPEMVRGLAYRDPLGFGELWEEIARKRFPAEPGIAAGTASEIEGVIPELSERGLFNLVRNLFPNRPLTPQTIRGLWDRVDGLSRLLLDGITKGDIGAARALAELIRSMTQLFPAYPDPEFRSFLEELGERIAVKLIGSETAIRAVFWEVWWELYFNPEFWEIRPDLGKWLRQFRSTDPELFRAAIRGTLVEHSQLLVLIGLFELLVEPAVTGDPESPAGSKLSEEWVDLRRKLCTSDEGCLWLIDRLQELDPDQALRLANMGLRRNNGFKDSYRERLIVLHQLRGDLRQAAALSFLQFRDKPVLEEYLRLRSLLAKFSDDWFIYRERIREIIKTGAFDILAVQIAIADGDGAVLIEQWPRIITDTHLLLDTADLFQQENLPPELAEFFPQLIRALLTAVGPEFPGYTRRTLIRFKKFCYHHDHRTKWEDLRRSLLEDYRDDLTFQYRFGSLLENS